MKLQVEEALKEEGRKVPFSFQKPAADLGDVDAFPWKTMLWLWKARSGPMARTSSSKEQFVHPACMHAAAV